MSDTIPCPGCRAELVLPGLPEGETVQCPRCQHVFEAIRGHAALVSAPLRPLAVDDPGDDAFDFSPSLSYYQPLRGQLKATVAIFFLVLSVLSYGLQMYVNWENRQLILLEEQLRQPLGGRDFRFRQMLIGNMVEQPLVDLDQRWENWTSLSEGAAVLHYLTYWPAVLFVLIWLNQAAWNLQTLKTAGLKFSPSWATVSFFVPFANLWLPYQAVQEVWRASEPSATRDPVSWQQVPRGRMVQVWWLSFLAVAICSTFSMWIGSFRGDNLMVANPDELLDPTILGIMNFFMIVAGAALISVIHGIHARQRARHARVYDEAA